MAESPGRRLGRRQAREGIERIAEPRHGTATRGADEPRQAAGSGLMGVRMGYGDIDLWALGSRGARDRTGADVDLQRHGSGGISAAVAE